MRSARIYRGHDAASQTKFQDVKQLARSQRRILSGTPGTLKQRTQSGNQYWVREYIRVDGKKTDEYIGPVNTVDKETIARISAEMDLAKSAASGSGHLRLLGYQRIGKKPAAVLEVLYNKGLFNGGLTLVGSHTYGILLNELGIVAPAYTTEDIDLARGSALALALPASTNFQSLLRETGLPFVPVPGMPSHRPSASFKLPGSERLAVDLLVAGRKAGEVVPVKELDTYAQAIPLLDFLIKDPMQSVALSPNQVIPVLVPSPEHFVLHKLYSSQSRTSGNRDKIRKDLQQAAVLAAALEEEMPERLKEAYGDLPNSGKSSVKKGISAVAKLLEQHEPAKQALLQIGKR